MARQFITNFVGFSTASDLAKIGKGYTLNMFRETQDSTEHAFTSILRPFPGYKGVAYVDGTPRGLYRVSRGEGGKPCVYGVWGDVLYLLSGVQALPVGNVNVGTDDVHFAETGGEGSAHPHLVVVDGKGVFAVDTTLRYGEQIADFRQIALPYRAGTSDRRIEPTHVAYAYGYLVVNDSGTDAMHYTYQYPFEKTNSKGEIENDIFRCVEGSSEYLSPNGWVEYSEWQPDNTLALIGNGSRIFTFGERSYQIFSYSTLGDTPFTSPDTASQMIGIKNADTLCGFGSRVMWLGSAEMGECQVFSLSNDGTLERISTPEIERRISKFNVATAKAFSFQYWRHPFYCLSFQSDGVTLCYDFSEQGWVDLGSFDSSRNIGCYRYFSFALDEQGRYLAQYAGGVAMIDGSRWCEHDDTPILRKRTGGIVQVNHSAFFIDAVRLLTNNGEYSGGKDDYRNDYRVTMRYSSDGVTFTDAESFSLGKSGQYDFDVVWYNLGIAKYFTFEVSCSEDVPFAIYGIDASIRAMR